MWILATGTLMGQTREYSRTKCAYTGKRKREEVKITMKKEI